MNIFEKMAAITAELQTVAKSLTVQQTKNSSYKAVSERDILDAVKPLEEKQGVYSYPASRKVIESNMLESESTYNNQTTKKTTFMTRIETVYRFVNVEKPEEYIETTTFAEGIDTQDKGSGKAMTYADKYALMKAYKISTGEDPDQTASERVDYTPVVDPLPTYKECLATVIDFGEYNGKTLRELFKTDRNYINALLNDNTAPLDIRNRINVINQEIKKANGK